MGKGKTRKRNDGSGKKGKTRKKGITRKKGERVFFTTNINITVSVCYVDGKCFTCTLAVRECLFLNGQCCRHPIKITKEKLKKHNLEL